MNRALIGVAMVVAGLSGCATPARIVQKNPDSVVVAIPENSDVWPTHYRAAADALAKQSLGSGYQEVSAVEVVTGPGSMGGPGSNVPPGAKEYRITYMKKPPQPPIPYGPGSVGMRPLPTPGTGVSAGMPIGAGMGTGLPVGGMNPGMQPASGSMPMGGMSGGTTTAGGMSGTVPSVAPLGSVNNQYPYGTAPSTYPR